MLVGLAIGDRLDEVQRRVTAGAVSGETGQDVRALASSNGNHRHAIGGVELFVEHRPCRLNRTTDQTVGAVLEVEQQEQGAR